MHVLELAFGALMSIFIGVLAHNAKRVIEILDQMQKSVAELNIRVAVVIDRMSAHEKRLDKHENEIKSLQTKDV